MHELLNILAQERGDGFELLWIIAVLVLSALGGLAEWIKKRRAEKKMKDAIPRSRKSAAPPRRPASGTPSPARPPVSRPQATPSRPIVPARQRAPRAQPARKTVPPEQPRHPAGKPPPKRGTPARQPSPGQLPPAVAARRQREATGKPTAPPPPKRKEQAPAAQPVRTAEMARQEVADRRPNIARELIFKHGQRLGREDWRRAVILNELFGRPVALRSDEYLWDR